MPRRAWIRYLVVLALCLALGPAVALGKPKPKKPKKPRKPGPIEVVIDQKLEGSAEAIGQCTAGYVGPATPKVDVSAAIAINHAGIVLSCQVTVNVPPPGGDQVRACVEQILRSITYPASDRNLIPINKTWSYHL